MHRRSSAACAGSGARLGAQKMQELDEHEHAAQEAVVRVAGMDVSWGQRPTGCIRLNLRRSGHIHTKDCISGGVTGHRPASRSPRGAPSPPAGCEPAACGPSPTGRGGIFRVAQCTSGASSSPNPPAARPHMGRVTTLTQARKAQAPSRGSRGGQPWGSRPQLPAAPCSIPPPRPRLPAPDGPPDLTGFVVG